MDEWIVYGLIRDHMVNLRLMLDRCRQHQIALNSKKCIFCAPFGMFLGNIVCKQGLLVDLTNSALILSLLSPTNVKMLRATLGNTGYYRKFIRGYAAITTSMEKLLKKDATFVSSQECEGSFDTLKDKMGSTSILVFPDWNKDFHDYVDALSFALGVVLAQPREGDLDHLIAFTSQKLSFVEKNYITTEREG